MQLIVGTDGLTNQIVQGRGLWLFDNRIGQRIMSHKSSEDEIDQGYTGGCVGVCRSTRPEELCSTTLQGVTKLF